MHIPRPFTEERPSLHFTKDHFDVRMSEHPKASQLPVAGSEPAIFPGASDFASLALGPGAPKTLDDYLYSDVPLFGLHVVTFEDGTLVSINFHHIVSDVAGLRYVLDAWQLHLAGKPEAKAEFMSVEDAMRPLYEGPHPEEHVIEDSRLTGWKLANFGIRYLWDSWWIPYETRTVCVPKGTMDRILQSARNDLVNSVKDGQETPFITEGDVLLAVAMRLAAYNLPEGSRRSLNMLIAVDPRGRATSVFRKDAAYVQNAPSGAFLTTSAPKALETPLGDLALHMRKAIALQTTEEQLKAAAFAIAETYRKSGNLPVYGDHNGLLTTSSNWSKAKLLESVDFSRAVVKRGATSREPGRPVFYHSRSLERGTFSTSVLVIMGRDLEGNMWLSGDYPDSTWSKLIEFLKSQ